MLKKLLAICSTGMLISP